MKRATAITALIFLLAANIPGSEALGYVADTTVPLGGGCPQADRWNLSLTSPLNRRWSTSLSPAHTTVITVASWGSAARLNESEAVVTASFAAWSGVTGTTFNTAANPGLISALGRASDPN